MKTHKNAAKAFAVLLLSGVFLMFADSAFSIGVCTNINTNTGTLIPVGSNPRQVLTGDINGDNATDAAVLLGSGSSGNTVVILINNGRGSLSSFTSLQVNFSIGAMSLADFNLDGALDLAVAGTSSFSSGTPLYIYFGNGNGTFSSPLINSFQGSAVAIANGDFNSDGFPDLAIANSGSSSGFGAVTLFLNAGFGSFSLAGNFPVGGVPRDIKTADFDGDNNLDIVVANSNNTGSILRGNGAGGFLSATNFTLFPGSSSNFNVTIAVGDLNNDNRPDLAVANGDSNNISILINSGSGNFAAPVNVSVLNFSFRPRAITIGQYVGDGNLDIAVVTNSGFSDSVSAVVFLRGSGNGTFSGNLNDLKIVPTGSSPVSLADGDFDKDGLTDLITANSGSGDVSVLLNGGDNSYGPQSFSTNANPNQIVSADFNKDGNLDYAVSNTQINSTPNPNGIRVFLGDGMGGVTGSFTLVSGATQSLLTGDVNKDGRIDLIMTTSSSSSSNNSIFIYINRAEGPLFNSVPPDQSYSLPFTGKSMLLSDFNNDGNVDLVVTALSGNSAAILFGKPDGTFNQPSVFASPAGSAAVAAGDFNNDNNADLLFAGTGFNGQTGVFTLLGNGSGSFSPVSETLLINSAVSVVTADFNKDGKLDLAVATGSTFSGGISSVVVAFGDGDGTFTQSNVYPAGLNPIVLTVGDVNGDDFPDLVFASRVSNSLSVLLNNRNGTFRTGNGFLAGIFPEAITLGDSDNDGRLDFATANRGGNDFSIVLNTCLEAVTKTDYDGDSLTDFAVFRPSNGTWFVVTNDGNSKSRTFGMEGDIPVPGDYDGDGITDFAVFRPSTGTWHIVRSSTNFSYSVRWGTNGDIPVANDFDGDGRSDIAVFRPSNGAWYIIRSSQPVGFFAVQFGQQGDIPVAADYDGDGRADIAVYRDGLWIILQSSDSSIKFQQFGLPDDKPVQGDYDGDGRADIAVYRNGNWYVLPSKTGTFYGIGFGLADDVPQPGDYDGDGKTDTAVFRPGEGKWYVSQSSDGRFRAVTLGNSGDIPVSSIYHR